MAEATLVAQFDGVVRTVADARTTRWWLEAELSALLPATAVDAITSAIAELLNAACVPGHPVELRVRVLADEVRIDVECHLDGLREVDGLAGWILAGAVDTWGLGDVDGRGSYWARLRLL